MSNDRALAPLFLCRGARFIAAGRWAQARGHSDELVLSHVCWGLELVLKAYLLAHGCTDDHNRHAHGHDLIKAGFAAQRLGLKLSRRLEWLLVDAAPYARRHAISEALARRPDLLSRHQPLDLAEDLVRRVSCILSRRTSAGAPGDTLLFYAG